MILGIVSCEYTSKSNTNPIKSTVCNVHKTAVRVLLLRLECLLLSSCGVCGDFCVTLGAAGLLTLSDSISKLTVASVVLEVVTAVEEHTRGTEALKILSEKPSCLQTDILHIGNQKDV